MGPALVRAAVTEDHTLGGVNNGNVFTYGSGGYKFKLKLLFVYFSRGNFHFQPCGRQDTLKLSHYKTKYLFKIIDSQESKKNSQKTKSKLRPQLP